MIANKKSFEKLQKHLEEQEEKREEIIQSSREVIKLSKQVIYALHRDDKKTAELSFKEISPYLKRLKEGKNYDTNMASVALQEYVEAACYKALIEKSILPSDVELKVDPEEYLLGLCDLTGELMRKAVNAAIQNDKETVIKIRELVDEIYGFFITLNLRNGELRKKSDAIKWNLRKIEDVLLSLKYNST